MLVDMYFRVVRTKNGREEWVGRGKKKEEGIFNQAQQ